VRATNWLGDAVMSLPAVRALREAMPEAYIAVAARPSVADIYARENAIDRVIPYPKPKGLRERYRFAVALRAERFDAAVLLQNAFDAALMAWLARIPVRIGYDRDARGFLLTEPIPVPVRGETPAHERFYYLELFRRAGIIGTLPDSSAIRLGGVEESRDAGLRRMTELGIARPAIGISPGAAYGNAKRWLPERFAEAGEQVARELKASVLLFGSPAERALCDEVAAPLTRAGVAVHNLAGETTLADFVGMAAACLAFLTNDSGAMHVASALGLPTVAVFGATEDATTGPTGANARVVREPVACSPCLMRECPIDHRCMTRVSASRVAEAALELVEESAAQWTQEAKS
jgi:heptosyltransferase II